MSIYRRRAGLFYRGVYNGAGAGASLILDTLAVQPVAAFSLRKLRTAYTGACIRVRRSSDNAEQDIGFVADVLDSASLLSFVGANNGFIVTRYGQNTGAQINATRPTAAEQPLIVSAGVLLLLNSRAAELYDGVDDFLATAGIASLGAAPMTTVGVLSVAALNGTYRSWWGVGDGANNQTLDVGSGNPQTSYYVGGPFVAGAGTGTTIVANTPYVATQQASGGATTSWLNGALNPESNALTITGGTGQITLGSGRGASASATNIRLAEMLAFNSVLSTTDRQTIERNQGTFYGITVA